MSLIPIPCPKCGRFHGCPPPDSKLTVSEILPEWAALHEKASALAAAQAAVVKAAMDLRSTMHQVLIGIDDYMVVDHYSPEWQAYNAACADLKKLGG